MTNRVARRALATALVVGVTSSLPPVQARIKAAGVVADALERAWPRPFAESVVRDEVQLGDVSGDLYAPGDEAPPIVLVHGAATQGKDDPRLIRLARSLAAADRLVFVPDIELKNRTFEGEDIERIVGSIDALADHPAASGARVQVIGISYGGSFALIAAADERVRDNIEQVAVFGAYFDLVGYIQAITTGISVVDGNHLEWQRPPGAEDLLRELTVEVAPAELRSALRRALEDETPQELPLEGRRIYSFLANEDPERTYDLYEDLPEEMRDLLTRFSPSTNIEDLQAPVIALHARNDPAVPYAESLRLTQARPDARFGTLERFSHVDLEGGLGEVARDLFQTWRFTSWILSAQEDFF